jgi:poly(A) polymerase
VWSAATLAYDRPAPNFLPQLRSFAEHRDRATGVDLAFAGQNPRGIFSGGYEPSLPGRIRWGTAPELGFSDVSAAGLSGTSAGLRVSSFAECNGRLYAAIGQQIYERIDGKAAQWRLVYTNRYPGHSETGLRGLTAIPAPSGKGEVLLAAIEGSAARIVRVDPHDGSEVTELDLPDFLRRHWGMPANYVIAAYNDMARVPDPAGGKALLIGLEAFIPLWAEIAPGHSVVPVGYGRLEAGGWYLVRRVNGYYDLGQVAVDRALVATRAIQLSPFSEDRDAVYFAGYDANKTPAHNTAWIYKASAATATGAATR